MWNRDSNHLLIGRWLNGGQSGPAGPKATEEENVSCQKWHWRRRASLNSPISGSLFGSSSSCSCQPVNQQLIGGGAPGKHHPHLNVNAALNGSVCSPLQVTEEEEKKNYLCCQKPPEDVRCLGLPDSQVSFDLLFRCYLGNVLLGFIHVVVLHTNFNKSLKETNDKWSRYTELWQPSCTDVIQSSPKRARYAAKWPFLVFKMIEDQLLSRQFTK